MIKNITLSNTQYDSDINSGSPVEINLGGFLFTGYISQVTYTPEGILLDIDEVRDGER